MTTDKMEALCAESEALCVESETPLASARSTGVRDLFVDGGERAHVPSKSKRVVALLGAAAMCLAAVCLLLNARKTEPWTVRRAETARPPPKAYSASTEPTPVVYAMSGGGMLAQAANIGYANAFYMAGLNDMELLAALSANGGSSWFLMFFAYSASFHAALSGPASGIAAFTEGFFNRQLTGAKQKVENPKPDAPQQICDFLREAGIVPPQVHASCYAAANHGYIWRLLINDMLKWSVDPKVSYDKVMADTKSRTGSQWPSLHFQMTALTSAYIYSDIGNKESDTESLFAKAFKFLLGTGGHVGPDAADVLDASGKNALSTPLIPLQWFVPSYSESQTGSTSGYINPHHGDTPEKSYTESEGIFTEKVFADEYEKTKPLPPIFNGTPSVVDIAAASSAAGGVLGSPELMRESLDYACKPMKDTLMTFMPAGMQGMAVCSAALYTYNGSEYCPYPAERLIDGAYVDDTATVQTLAHMQKRYGISQRMRLILTLTVSSDLLNEPGHSGLKMLSDLMENDMPYSGKPGTMISGDDTESYFGVKRRSPQVFDSYFGDLTWANVTQPAGASHSVQYTNFTATTVANTAFGVQGGTIVDLLVFATSSEVGLYDIDAAQDYSSLASDIALSGATGIVSKWLENTGGKGPKQTSIPTAAGENPVVVPQPSAKESDQAVWMAQQDSAAAKLGLELSAGSCLGEQCFPGDATVQVRGRGIVPLASLRRGEHVLVDRRGVLEYEPVIGFLHSLPAGTGTKYRYVTVVHARGEFRASASHLVLVRVEGGESTHRVAASLRPGDMLVTVVTETEGVMSTEASAVVAIRHDIGDMGMFAPLTPSGTIVVDGVAASNYATPSLGLLLPHALAHSAFFLVRLNHWLGLDQLLDPVWRFACGTTMGSWAWLCQGGDLSVSGREEMHPLIRLYKGLSLDRLLIAS